MDDSLKVLKAQLKELKLRHLAAKLDDMMLEVGNSDKSYAQIIQEFLAVEIQQRRALSMGKRLRYANFPLFDKPMDIDAYDFSKRRGVSKRQIIELTNNFIWVDKAYNVLFFGGSGLGKSYLACYIGYKAIEAGYDVIFISMHNLAHLIKTENILARSKTRMKRLKNCDLLIIDEVGNTVLDRPEGNRMFQLISDFYQHTSLIVTANRGFEDWSQALGDNVVTSAVMDRLLHKCEIFNLDGESWRLEDQQSILKNLFKGGEKHV